MKFLVVLSCVFAVAVAKPGFLAAGYTAILPGAPLGADGRVVDTAEVSLAKAEHAAAHINEKLSLKQEALRSADLFIPAHTYAAAPLAYAAGPALAPAAIPVAAPLAYASHAGVIGPDGRPLDTPEVALAKAEHAAHHINDRLVQAAEAARNYGLVY